MNFNNQLQDDDEQLIHLLKERALETLSDQLVETTMAKLSAIRAEKRFAYKPLRAPLYVMLTVVLILLLPVFVPIPASAFLNLWSTLSDYPISPILKYAVLCWLTVVALSISRLLLPNPSNLKF